MSVPRDPDRSHDPNDPARKPSDDPRAATPAANPDGDGDGDADDIIPHSAKATADYHDGIKDLADAFMQHHGTLHEEMTRHFKAMEHPEITPQFEKWLGEHTKEMQRHSEWAGGFAKEMSEAFDKHHAGLGKLSDSTEETKVPRESKPTQDKHSSKSPEAEKDKGEGKAIESPAPEISVATKDEPPAQAKSDPLVETKAEPVLQTKNDPPVETKTQSGNHSDDLDEAHAALILGMLERIDKKSAAQAQRLESELVGAV